MVKYFWILLLLATSCSSERQLVELNSVDDTLKLNGCYVKKLSNGWNMIYFIYGNGVFKTHGGTKLKINKIPKYLKDSLTSNKTKYTYRDKSNFGIINIINDSIEIQLWPSGLRAPSTLQFGRVKNNTQFVINKLCQLSSFGKLTNCESRNDIYNFVELENKPDSTNPFIRP